MSLKPAVSKICDYIGFNIHTIFDERFNSCALTHILEITLFHFSQLEVSHTQALIRSMQVSASVRASETKKTTKFADLS